MRPVVVTFVWLVGNDRFTLVMHLPVGSHYRIDLNSIRLVPSG